MGLLLAVLLVPASSLAQEPIGNEVAEFDATQGLEERLAPIVQHVLANPDDFGGLYLDASANRLNVAIVDRSGRAESALRALGPVGVEIRVRPAIHTERELKQVSEEALLKSAEWLPKGVEVFWTSVDIPTNTVQVGVSGSAATVEPILRERFGPAIHVVEDEAVEPIVCTSRTNCTPWRGGIDVNNIDHPADGGCTAAFSARPTGTSDLRYMLTAGHCHDGRYYHNGAFIGTATVNSLDGGTTVNSDSLRIPRSSTSPMNLIFVTEEAPAVYGRSIGAYRPTSQQLMGNAVCKSGRTTWYDCGTITSANFNYSISHEGRVFTIIGGKLASTIVNPGDSGGPVFYGSTAYGIMSARTSNGSLAYTGVEQAMSTLGIRLCLNSACS